MHGSPPVPYCGLPHCPCGMADWGRLGGTDQHPLCVRLPDAPGGVMMDVTGVTGYKRSQLQDAIV